MERKGKSKMFRGEENPVDQDHVRGQTWLLLCEEWSVKTVQLCGCWTLF